MTVSQNLLQSVDALVLLHQICPLNQYGESSLNGGYDGTNKTNNAKLDAFSNGTTSTTPPKPIDNSRLMNTPYALFVFAIH
jgi:hypothetical protein